MKNRINSIFALAIILMSVKLQAQTPTNSKNYIMETVVKHKGHTTSASLSSLPVDSANRTISYFDGLGRPLQTVQWQASPGKKDIVGYNVYDALGREAVKYLPYADSVGSDGSYRANAAAKQASFYGSGSWDANIVKTPYPYSRTVFEASPLNRVLEQGSPGAVWQPYSGSIAGSGHTVRTDNAFNGTGEVALWTVGSSGASTSGSYAANTLYKTVTRDGNWTSGKAGTVAEFRDLQGRTVLKRQWKSDTDSLSTFYVYDDLGNLRYVVPPAVTTGFSESDAAFNSYVYAYRYDGRRRVTGKKIPGRGWEYLVYNRLDQVVLTQDSVMRAGSKWWFNKYDALGRTIVSGLVTSTWDAYTWQAAVDGQPHLWEKRDNADSTGMYTGYTNVSLPTGPFYNYYVINYYDDYDFYGNPFGQPVPPRAGPAGTRGLLTGSSSLVIGNGAMMYTANYYDSEGRLVEAKSQNHLGGTDSVVNTYSFAGELTATTRYHIVGGTATTVPVAYVYDHMGRKSSTWQNINGQGEVVLDAMEYNGIGQLKRKYLHSTNSGATFLQHTEYSYNERGWLKGSTSPEFSMKLGYDTLSNPQYNGNISTQLWGSGSSFPNRFDYQYDKLNRLTNGTSTGITMSEDITYDNMGNIHTLARDGGAARLYVYNGNQLSWVEWVTNAYAYDGNGNATTDGRLGAAFAYNFLNLPSGITKTGLDLAYVYDGTGRKLKKVNGTTSTTTDYVDGIQYTNGSIEFIQTEEGRALNSGGTYIYEYDLTDHLGNVRAVFRKNSNAPYDVEVIQRDDYYAFGLRRPTLVSSPDNKYLYNGKELQDELGQYDYGARFYDPIIGRWNVVDAMASTLYEISPYAYVRNNPALRIDQNGLWDITVHAFKDREKYGYGIAVVTDRNGKEVYRFNVRLQGVGGKDRSKANSDTPLGVYDIPDKNMWISGGSRAAYGANPRLALIEESGEIKETGRGLIRIHGGRQELYDAKTGLWTSISNAELKKTQGCMRCKDENIKTLKQITDKLMEKDSKEKGGKLTIIDDLVEVTKNNPVPLKGTSTTYVNPGENATDEQKGQWNNLIKEIFGIKK